MESYQFSGPLSHSEGDMGKERPQKAILLNVEDFFLTQFRAQF